MRSMSIAVKRESAAAGLSVRRLYLLVNRIAELDQGARGDAVRMFTSRKGCGQWGQASKMPRSGWTLATWKSDPIPLKNHPNHP